jgi:hypothetical protein
MKARFSSYLTGMESVNSSEIIVKVYQRPKHQIYSFSSMKKEIIYLYLHVGYTLSGCDGYG